MLGSASIQNNECTLQHASLIRAVWIKKEAVPEQDHGHYDRGPAAGGLGRAEGTMTGKSPNHGLLSRLGV